MVDCFDGYLPTWTIGLRPNANLVNTMLDNLAKKLKDGTKPIILQTEDAITGGLAGLAGCRQTAG